MAVSVESSVHARAADIVGDLRNSSAGPYMDFGNVVTVMFGLPALLGFTLLVSFQHHIQKVKTMYSSSRLDRKSVV